VAERDAGLRTLILPPGAGKTEAAVALARAAASSGARVIWLGLPHQRDHLRRIVRDGPLLGLRFLSRQRLALTQLTRAGALPRPLPPTARVVAVGDALPESGGGPPTPGEASVYSAAIGEAKRYGLTPDRVAHPRLADVFAAYERRKGDAADEEDVRALALADARAADPDRLRDRFDADTLIVDGWREIGAFDAAYFTAIARGLEVFVTAAVALPGVAAVDDAPPPYPLRIDAWRFPNPVAEVRWLLRAVARDLAAGLDPRDVAVVAPPATARALLALAPEHGVPFVDHAPRSLADTPFGRQLVDLLELPQFPTAARLLTLPELRPLARIVASEGVAGREAIAVVAQRHALTDPEEMLARLTPHPDWLAWARAMVALAGDLTPGVDEAALARAQESALRRAQEASIAAGDPEGLRAWWLALLRAAAAPTRPAPGVALLPPSLSAGLRFRRAYLAGAVAAAYDLGESEDPFLPEDARGDEPATYPAAHLPRRLRGGDVAWRRELRARADWLTITAAEADRAGPLRFDPALIGSDAQAAPTLPSASPLEATVAPPYHPPPPAAAPERADVETLRAIAPCPFAAWAREVAPPTPSHEAARARAALLAGGPPDDAWQRAHPGYAAWAQRHAAALAPWRYRERLRARVGPGVVEATLHAVQRQGERVTIVTFLLPSDPLDTPIRPDLRFTELWAADLLRRRYPRLHVDLLAWPMGGDPTPLTPRGVDAAPFELRRERIRSEIERAAADYFAGPPTPRPGWACRGCAAADFCRVAAEGA
jgi:ATP-dependent helicase/nuclease subunit B